jgi:hypothetical protein
MLWEHAKETAIMMAMLTEMYLHVRAESRSQALEQIINHNLTKMSAAEDKSESEHFIKGE